MDTDAASRRPAGAGAEALLPMTTGRHSTRFAGSAVVPSGPQSRPATAHSEVSRVDVWFE
jgi:hypothetical protein